MPASTAARPQRSARPPSPSFPPCGTSAYVHRGPHGRGLQSVGKEAAIASQPEPPLRVVGCPPPCIPLPLGSGCNARDPMGRRATIYGTYLQSAEGGSCCSCSWLPVGCFLVVSGELLDPYLLLAQIEADLQRGRSTKNGGEKKAVQRQCNGSATVKERQCNGSEGSKNGSATAVKGPGKAVQRQQKIRESAKVKKGSATAGSGSGSGQLVCTCRSAIAASTFSRRCA